MFLQLLAFLHAVIAAVILVVAIYLCTSIIRSSFLICHSCLYFSTTRLLLLLRMLLLLLPLFAVLLCTLLPNAGPRGSASYCGALPQRRGNICLGFFLGSYYTDIKTNKYVYTYICIYVLFSPEVNPQPSIGGIPRTSSPRPILRALLVSHS